MNSILDNTALYTLGFTLVCTVVVMLWRSSRKSTKCDFSHTFPFDMKVQNVGLIVTHANGCITTITADRLQQNPPIVIKSGEKILVRPFLKGKEEDLEFFKVLGWTINSSKKSYLKILVSQASSSLYIHSVLTKNQKLNRPSREVFICFEALDSTNGVAYWVDFTVVHATHTRL